MIPGEFGRQPIAEFDPSREPEWAEDPAFDVPDDGPPTQASSVFETPEPDGGTAGDRFLDELSRASANDDDFGAADEEADAAMAAFFDQDEEDERWRGRFGR